MKYLGKITDSKDLVTKEYVDNSIPAAASTTPAMSSDTAAIGVSEDYARADHVHPSDMFVATYGTTTSAEIGEAYQAGKKIFVKYSKLFLPLTFYGLSHYEFSSVYRRLQGANPTGPIVLYQIWCVSDSWSNEATVLTQLNSIAEQFVNDKNYSTGDYVYYLVDGNVYRFISDHAAGAWNASEVVRITYLTDELNDLRASVTNADWEEDDTEAASYVENRPAIRAGEGANSIIEGRLQDADSAAEYVLTISGAERATTFSYTTSDTLPSDFTLLNSCYAYYSDGITSYYKYHHILSIDTTNQKIELSGPLSTSAISGKTLIIYFGKATQSSGGIAHAEGYSTIASGTDSHAEGSKTISSGTYSHAEGSNTTASGSPSHAEGGNTIARGDYSHAEGNKTISSGMYSHAEGYSTTASGTHSHAEGSSTTASNTYSHAEGCNTIAGGSASHAEGNSTIARGSYSHAQGKYNIEDTSNLYADIVGNGTADDARSNAYTLDWSGNGVYSGKLTVGSGPTANMDVATKQYVDENSGGDTILRTWVAGTEVSS